MHRKFCRMQKDTRENNEFYGDSGMQSLFIFLVLNAAHKPCQTVLKNIGKPLEKGEILTSYPELMAWSGLSRKQVTSRVQKMAKEGTVEVKSKAKRGLLISICNYSSYQATGDDEVKFEGNVRETGGKEFGQEEGIHSEEVKENKKIKNKKRKTEIPNYAESAYAKIYTHILSVPSWKKIFDLKRDEKYFDEIQTRYDLTIDEIEELAFKFKNWASSREIKSPLGTFTTFAAKATEKKIAITPETRKYKDNSHLDEENFYD